MAEVVKKPIKITETILRDAHQSLIATRMTTEQMLPIVDKLDKVGYHSVECWGGATFDASLRFLKEDPWERLRKLRDGFKNTKLQMLFRGQNILGYRPYADDVVEYFVQKSIANGIDIIRIFDCFNDLRNLQTAVKAANKEKGHAQVALSYTLGDAYTLEYWTDMAKKIEEMGADSICIKDMAGLLLPYKATELVSALKEATSLPIQLHTHYTSGVASMTYMKAVEAGVDVIDTAMSPFALGTSQPATEVMVETFKGTPYDTDLTRSCWLRSPTTSVPSGMRLSRAACLILPTWREYQDPAVSGTGRYALQPDFSAEGAARGRQVLRCAGGSTQSKKRPGRAASGNAFFPDRGNPGCVQRDYGERYKMVTKETKDILCGKYGATVKPFNPEVQKKCIGNAEVITHRPATIWSRASEAGEGDGPVEAAG